MQLECFVSYTQHYRSTVCPRGKAVRPIMTAKTTPSARVCKPSFVHLAVARCSLRQKASKNGDRCAERAKKTKQTRTAADGGVIQPSLRNRALLQFLGLFLWSIREPCLKHTPRIYNTGGVLPKLTNFFQGERSGQDSGHSRA